MSEYEILKHLTEVGIKLGYEGETLREFVAKAQADDREERQRVRAEKEKEAERLEREANRNHELAMERLKRTSPTPSAVQSNHPKPKLPKYDENVDDLDAYLERFERYARTHQWPEDEWAVNLSPLLTGKALEAYVCLSAADAVVYEKVKKAILQRYMMTEEGYRMKFRETNPEKGETVNQFSARMCRYFERWITLSEIQESYEGLKDLILREQFLRKCHAELRMFLKERSPATLAVMIEYTEKYLAAHGGAMYRCIKLRPKGDIRSETEGTANSLKASASSVPKQQALREGRCFLCGQKGHIAKNCRQTSVAKDTKFEKLGACSTGKDQEVTLPSGEKVPLIVGAGTIDEDDGLTIESGFVNKMPVRVLKDSGCTGIVVRKNYVRPEQMTHNQRKCILIDNTVRICPIANIWIDTPFHTGEVEALCMENPICDLIVGNVKPSSEVSYDPVLSQGHLDPGVPSTPNSVEEVFVNSTDKVSSQQEILGAVETRAQSKKTTKLLKVEESPDHTPNLTCQEQENDFSLQRLINQESAGTCRIKLVKENGLWFKSGSDKKGEVIHQLLIPKSQKKQILSLAHESLMGGHLGVQKTTDRILQNFYWPGIMGDVKRWCRSCDICQRTIPKGRVSKVPLGKTPIMGEPFQKVAIDLVGPISPPSSQGNRYILTLVDYATRWPEAIALKSITTSDVSEALLTIFSRLGFPREIFSDQGSQFTSDLMKEVCRLINVKQAFTTPYHPMANGLNEKFNGTLKAMIKKMCQERPSDWDRYLHAVLFAYREVPQASTGFSPFELLYGRSVRGPLGLLKEMWTNRDLDPNEFNTYQYVADLRNRLEETCEVVHQNVMKSAERYKHHYDKNRRMRSLEVGDKVLVLLPTDSNKLLLSWKGPFPVLGKVGVMDYSIQVNNKSKVFHINLLKKYECRNKGYNKVGKDCVVTGANVVSNETDEGDLVILETSKCETHEQININPELSPEQKEQLQALILEFSDIFTSKPGVTNLVKHKIELTETEPVREKQYPLPFSTKEVIEKEVESMLKEGIIERSNSSYCAPVVLIKKPDGTFRFCVNFKKLNKVTKFDCEPMNRPESILAKLEGKRYFSKVDFTKGFWQIEMEESSKSLMAFATESGCYQFKRMPFGLVNSPSSYNRLMRELLAGQNNVDNYVDDVLGHTVNWEEHLLVLRNLFESIRQAGLTVRPSKCFLGYNSVEFLGHKVGNGQITPLDRTVQKILEKPHPNTKKELRSFLGLIGWYQKFIPHYACLTNVLTDLLKTGTPARLRWGSNHQEAFEKLKKCIVSAPVLKPPDFAKPFVVQSDASDAGIGAALLQNHQGKLHPILFCSRKLRPREINYSVTEKEALAIIFAVKKFDQYLYGNDFVLHTDHSALEYIQKKKPENARLLRWSLFLLNYRFTVKAIKGCENVLADFLSRM